MSIEKLANDEHNFRWYQKLTPTVNEWALYAFLSATSTLYITHQFTKLIAEGPLGRPLSGKEIALYTIASFIPQIMAYGVIRAEEFTDYIMGYKFVGDAEQKRMLDK